MSAADPTLFQDHAHALVVGIARYQHAWIRDLPVTDDVKDIAGLLRDPRQCGYRPENVTVLTDGEATRDAVLAGLKQLGERAGGDSTVFLYYSGHGGRIQSGAHAGEYLLPSDADRTSDETLAQTCISGREMTEALRAIAAPRLVVVFDCCHAGGVGQPKGDGGPALLPGLSEGYYEALGRGKGRVVFASSRSDESSYIMPGDRHSLFTKHFLAALRGGVASEDGVIRVFQLFEYLQPRITGESPKQHPVFKADLQNNFPLALYHGGKRGTVPRAEDGYLYDAYVSHADRDPDSAWVWDILVPRLEQAGLKIAVSNDVQAPGVARVVGANRAMEQSRRTLVVLSDAYLADRMGEFESAMAQTMGLEEGRYRVVPLTFAPVAGKVPTRLSMLTTLNLGHPQRAGREFDRLIRALKGPVPGMG